MAQGGTGAQSSGIPPPPPDDELLLPPPPPPEAQRPTVAAPTTSPPTTSSPAPPPPPPSPPPFAPPRRGKWLDLPRLFVLAFGLLFLIHGAALLAQAGPYVDSLGPLKSLCDSGNPPFRNESCPGIRYSLIYWTNMRLFGAVQLAMGSLVMVVGFIAKRAPHRAASAHRGPGSIEEEKEPVLVGEKEANLSYLLSGVTGFLGLHLYFQNRGRAEDDARAFARTCFVLGLIGVLAIDWVFLSLLSPLSVTYNQFLSTGIVRGAIYALYAIGLTLVYKILRLSNFAQSELFTVGGFAGLFFFNAYIVTVADWLTVLVISFILAFIISGFVGVATDLVAFRPLRARRATPLILMIASVGLGIFLRGLIQFFSGPDVRKYRLPTPPVVEYGCHVSSGQATALNCVSLFATEIVSAVLIVLIIVVIHIMLTRTDFGRTLRALSDSKELAEVSGINTDRAIIFLWVLSAGLTGLGGAVFGAVSPAGLTPFTGFFTLLLIFAAVILGTIGHVYGAIIGAFIVGIVDSVGAGMLTLVQGTPFELFGATYHFPTLSSEYSRVVVFLVLIAVLIVRPKGIFQKYA